MKHFVVVFGVLLCSWSNLLSAEESTPPVVGYVNHVIVNEYSQGLSYELNAPNTTVYTGFLNSGQVKRVNIDNSVPQLYGTYFLRYTVCAGWFSCKSYSQMLIVKQNEEVIWEITSTGVKITEAPI